MVFWTSTSGSTLLSLSLLVDAGVSSAFVATTWAAWARSLVDATRSQLEEYYNAFKMIVYLLCHLACACT